MIILDKPYVSDFLIQTIKKNDFRVFDNKIARKYFACDKLYNYALDNELFYSNSENSIGDIKNKFKNSALNRMIEICKNKALFRDTIKEIYPDYFYQKIALNDLKNYDVKKLKFPFILKPNIGFLSLGVYAIKDEKSWTDTISKLEDDIEKIKGVFPACVVDEGEFIIEEMIEGDEFALDAYFDKNSKAVILNIFHHPFFDENDVSDRLYYSSKEIIKKYLNLFSQMLDKIGSITGFKNFPFHIELRAGKKGVIPIEINPMRFCGWCITDIANFSYSINVYEYYFKKLKPDWDKILNNADDFIYYFTIAEIPPSVNKNEIKKIDYKKYLKNISFPLEIRKIDYKNNPIFAIVFAKTNSIDEIKNILKLDMKNFIESEKR